MRLKAHNDGYPFAELAGDVMEPHHHHALPLVDELVEDHRHLGEQRGGQPAQIDGVLLVPALQVLELRAEPPDADWAVTAWLGGTREEAAE